MSIPPLPTQRLIPFGRARFGAGLVALGMEHFILRDFIPGPPGRPCSCPV